MPEFIFMLTFQDKTVSDAKSVYQKIQNTGLRYVGFKDIGLGFKELKELSCLIHDGGQKVMLEVVSTSKEDEIRAASNAAELGVDYLLGGSHADEVSKIIGGSGIKYFPFPGKVLDHPSKLRGSIEELVKSARTLAAIQNVNGLDLLAYRYNGDVELMMNTVVKAIEIPVIVAGSIDSDERIRSVIQSGAWGFTMGSALFDGSYLSDSNIDLPSKIKHVLSFIDTERK